MYLFNQNEYIFFSKTYSVDATGIIDHIKSELNTKYSGPAMISLYYRKSSKKYVFFGYAYNIIVRGSYFMDVTTFWTLHHG